MLTFYSDDHRLHHAQGEMVGGEFKPCFEMPARADHVLARVRERNIGEVLAPSDFGLAPIRDIPGWPGIGPTRIRSGFAAGPRPRIARAGDGDGR